MRRVVDASVAIKWFCPEPMAEFADRILTFGFELLAPDFLLIECANVLLKKSRKREFDLKDVDAAIGCLSSGPVTLTRTTELIPQSLVLARELNHSGSSGSSGDTIRISVDPVARLSAPSPN